MYYGGGGYGGGYGGSQLLRGKGIDAVLIQKEEEHLSQVSQAIASVLDTSKDLCDFLPDGQHSDKVVRQLVDLRGAMEKLVQVELTLQAHIKAIRAAAREGAESSDRASQDADGGDRDEEGKDAEDCRPDSQPNDVGAETARALERIAAKQVDGAASREAVLAHPSFRELMSRVGKYVGGEDAGKDGEDEDLEEVGVGENVSVLCPLTRSEFVEPVRNEACGHTYSRAAVLEYISKVAEDGNARCPVAGCEEYVSLRSLARDARMENQLRRMQRRRGLAACGASQQPTRASTAGVAGANDNVADL